MQPSLSSSAVAGEGIAPSVADRSSVPALFKGLENAGNGHVLSCSSRGTNS